MQDVQDLPDMPEADAPKIDRSNPYRHLHTDDVQWLCDQLEAVNERVSDLFASDYDAIPCSLDAVNSAYFELTIELGIRGMGGEG